MNVTSRPISGRIALTYMAVRRWRCAGDFLVTLMPWLLAAALVDWWVTRTFTRFAIFIPKTPEMIFLYQWLNRLGLAGSTVAALLALFCILNIALVEWHARQRWWLALPITGLALITTIAPFFPPAIWLQSSFLLTVAVLLALSWRIVRMESSSGVRMALLSCVLAMLAAALYQAAPGVYTVLHWAGPPAWGLPLFRLGEGLVVLGSVALWWAYGQRADYRSWIAGSLCALFFAAVYHAAPAMTATMVVWSHGLTLSASWWFYAVALLFFSMTVIHNLRNRQMVVVSALLLLAAAGYAPQLSSQFCFGVIGIWLLVNFEMPPQCRQLEMEVC